MKNKKFYVLISVAFLLFGLVSSAQAINSLQLYLPDGEYSYALDQTWVIDGPYDFTLSALAIDSDIGASSEGDAFYNNLEEHHWAYLSVALGGDLLEENPTPSFGSLEIRGEELPTNGWSWGTPPPLDPNSLAPHAIFPTYYTEYGFKFDDYGFGVWDTQDTHDPGSGYTATGWREDFAINLSGINWDLVDWVHFDLYTKDRDGQVWKFAPFSHDAEYRVPEPATMLLLGSGLILMAGFGRKRFKS